MLAITLQIYQGNGRNVLVVSILTLLLNHIMPSGGILLRLITPSENLTAAKPHRG